MNIAERIAKRMEIATRIQPLIDNTIVPANAEVFGRDGRLKRYIDFNMSKAIPKGNTKLLAALVKAAKEEFSPLQVSLQGKTIRVSTGDLRKEHTVPAYAYWYDKTSKKFFTLVKRLNKESKTAPSSGKATAPKQSSGTKLTSVQLLKMANNGDKIPATKEVVDTLIKALIRAKGKGK